MTQEQLKEKYEMLYRYMASSGNTAYMKVFGKTMTEMMEWMIANKPEQAEAFIEKLCAIKWDNYLTQKEAEKIVANMSPKAPWTREVWKSAMDSFDIPVEESPYYNSCALWVEMNKVYSDSAKTIAMIKGKALGDVPAEDMVKAVHALAIDHLKDADGVYNIRSYFGV